ncbi:MAG: RNA-directed DNA polymerase [Bacillota bacterium]|nr:MAG: RNA-directed DNA polymerase [Bacillota bacterium]
MEKTRFVDFNKEDFNFMGFTFEPWRPRKKDSTLYYMVRPSEESLKDFRAKIKEKTKKTLTLNSKAWIERVNL